MDAETGDITKEIIIDALQGHRTGGGDIDCLLKTQKGFIMLEFLRCIKIRPYDSHPNRYWDYVPDKIGNKNKFLALWRLAQKTSSRLILINYEDSREQFKVIEVFALSDEQKIYEEKCQQMEKIAFTIWFQDMIQSAEK